MKKAKILFVKKSDTNPKFMTNDREILSEMYEVKQNNFRTSKNLRIIFTLAREFIYLLFNIWKFKLVYIWFADYHSFLPVLYAKLAGKKSVICAGGYECTYIPEINCGIFTASTFSKRIRNFCVTYSLKNCSIILPVDESLIKNTNTYIYSDIPGKAPLEDGIKNFIPEIETRITTLHLGYDAGKFVRDYKSEKSKTVISAGLIVNDDEYKRKGFDLLVEAAARMPDTGFVLIGFNDSYLRKISENVPPNVTLLKIVSYERLIEEYSKAKVFAQISMFEGMPSTLCEAMLCECIPVGSKVNGIPQIINNCGYLVEKKEIGELVDKLKSALNAGDDAGLKAREYIKSFFPLENRRDKLLKIIDSLLS